MKKSLSAMAFAVAVTSVATLAPATPPDGYHDYQSLTERLNSLVRDRAHLARLGSAGKTFESRDMWVVTLGQPEPGKPAIYLDAAHDGSELTATEVALGATAWLLESYPADSLVDLLTRVTLHVVPRANPDGVERAFRSPYQEQPLIPRPHDADHDTRIDEDGPRDVNGDGEITWMRVLDPGGRWTLDPADDRILVERTPEDDGPFFRLYREGLDDDDDGLVNEDPEGGVALLHNFPQGWEMDSIQPGAGAYATSERETVSLLEYFLGHPEIGTVITLSQGDRPERPGVGTLGYMPDADSVVFDSLDDLMEAARGRKLDVAFESPGRTGFGGAGQLIAQPSHGGPAPRGPRAVVPGSLLEWAYYQHGAFALSPQVWVDAPAVPEPDVDTDGAPADTVDTAAPSDTTDTDTPEPADAGDPESVEEDTPDSRDADTLAWLEWCDQSAPDGFIDWSDFSHPTLGAVEIGGFRRAPRTAAPRAVVDSLAEETARLLIRLAAEQPAIRIVGLSARPDGGLTRVIMTVENTGRLPSMSERGADARQFHTILAEIELPDGRTLLDTPARVRLGRLGPGERRTVEWLVTGAQGRQARVRAWSVRAGSDDETVSLEGGD